MYVLCYNLLLRFIPLEMHVRLICAIKFYSLTYLTRLAVRRVASGGFSESGSRDRVEQDVQQDGLRQWCYGRSGKAGQYRITIVQSAEHKRRKEFTRNIDPVREVFIYLLQSSNVIEASSRDFVDVILHRQFAIQGDPKVAYSVDTLNHITRDCQ